MRGDRTSYTQRTRSAHYSSSVLFRVRGPHQIYTRQSLYDSLCVSTCPWWVLEALKVAGRRNCTVKPGCTVLAWEKVKRHRGGVKIRWQIGLTDKCLTGVDKKKRDT